MRLDAYRGFKQQQKFCVLYEDVINQPRLITFYCTLDYILITILACVITNTIPSP